MVSGSWAWPAFAAAAPALFVLVTAGLLGTLSAGRIDDRAIGPWVRFRAALALLLQGVGAHLTSTTTVRPYADDAYSSSLSVTGEGAFAGSTPAAVTRTSTLSVVPLTVTLLWIAALVLALRVVRARQSGPEAAVRVALLSAAATLALALGARQSAGGVRVGTDPALAALGAFLIGLATALLALPGPGRAAWLAARPPLVTALRVLRTALLALLLTVVFAGLIVFAVAAGHDDDVTGWGLVAALFLLPDLGAAGLSLGWGGPFQAHISDVAGDRRLRTVGLSDLTTAFGGWATAGALLAGLLCALLIGLLAAWRSRDRAEQFMVAGAFTVLLVALLAVGGASVDESGDHYHARVGSNLPEALLFALLWSFGGVLAGPYVRRSVGGGPAPRLLAAGGWAAGSADGSVGGSTGGPGGTAGGAAGRQPGAPPTEQTPEEPAAAPPATIVHDLGLLQHERPEKPPA